MTWAFAPADVIDLIDAAGPVALVPAAFLVVFVVRIERWYRPVSRLAEAIRYRIAEGEQS